MPRWLLFFISLSIFVPNLGSGEGFLRQLWDNRWKPEYRNQNFTVVVCRLGKSASINCPVVHLTEYGAVGLVPRDTRFGTTYPSSMIIFVEIDEAALADIKRATFYQLLV